MAVFSPTEIHAQVPKKVIFAAPVGTTPAVFKVPAGVAIGASSSPGSINGTLFIADPENNQVVVFPPSSTPVTFSSLTCPATVAGCFLNPWVLSTPTAVAVAVDGGLWISDTGNDVVLEVDMTGTVTRFAGVGPSNVVCGGGCPPHPNAGQGNGQFFGPGSLAVDGTGSLYVADGAGDFLLNQFIVPAANIRLQKFGSNGSFLTTWGSFCRLNADGTQAAGNCNTSAPGAVVLGDGQFGFVSGLAVDDVPNLYVADGQSNNRVEKFDASGTFLLKWGGLPTGNANGQFNSMGGVAVDLDQTVYVVDEVNNRIQEFDTSGDFIGKGGSTGTTTAEFKNPWGIATVPPGLAFTCLLGGVTFSDCTHGFIVSEIGSDPRVQFLAGRPDTDNDGITDEVDAIPGTFSNNFRNVGLGFTTTGTVVSAGDQTFAIYNTLTPNAIDEIQIRTESFGGASPLTVVLCGTSIQLSFPAATGANVHCSTPTVTAKFGPVGFQFVSSNGVMATASLNTGASVSVNVSASQIIVNAGTINFLVAGKPVSLKAGQSIVLSPEADLAITKTGPTVPVAAGTVVNYNIAVSNAGPSDAPNVVVTDALPPGVVLHGTLPLGICSGTTTLTCNLGTLTNGSFTSFQIQVYVPSNYLSSRSETSATLSNTATVASSVTDPNLSNNTSTAATAVIAVADLSIAKSGLPNPVDAGTPLTYTITVNNAGPSDSTGTSVSDALPTGVNFTTSSISCTGTTTLTCSLGTVAAGATTSFTVTVAIPANYLSSRFERTATITNTATVSPGAGVTDPNLVNNTASVSTTVIQVADVEIAVSEAPNPVVEGGTATYTMIFTNMGPSDAPFAQILQYFPAGFTFAGSTYGTCGAGAKDVVCSLGPDMPVGYKQTFTITYKVPAKFLGGATSKIVTSQTGISSQAIDPDPTDSTIIINTTVVK